MVLDKQLVSYNNRLKAHQNSNLQRVHSFRHVAVGTLRLDASSREPYLYLESDIELLNYYHWFLIKQGVKLSKPKLGSHITVISREPSVSRQILLQYEGVSLSFEYWDLVSDNVYWWLEVSSPQIEHLRTNLNLTPRPKSGLHLTVGRIL